MRAGEDTLLLVGVVYTLVSSAVVGAAGSARAGLGMTELAIRRAPSLVVLGMWATVGRGSGAAKAEATFRDELLTLYDDAAEIAWRQMRRARLELGDRATPAVVERPDVATRRHRVKA